MKTKNHNHINNIGKKFNMLVVVDVFKTIDKNGIKRFRYVCKCNCGKTKNIDALSVCNYVQKSCGCLKLKNIKQKDGAYYNYYNMIQRCYNPKSPAYKYYGAKGIDVCNEWKESFDCFKLDMGNKPSKFYTIERIDNSKGYFKDNCRWATRKEQAQNTSLTKYFIFNGEKMTRSDICDLTGIKRKTIDYLTNKYKDDYEKTIKKYV